MTLPGTDGPDDITGTPQRDVIHAGAGDDVVDGAGGGDLICGGGGNDNLKGGASFDALFGEGGDDVLEGGADDDVLFVGEGLDEQRATGGQGYDVAYGDEGSETCAAEAMYICAVTNAESDQRLPFALPAAVPCDLMASSTGDDGNSGAPDAPFRTVERMVNTLQPGETGCLSPGELFTEPDQEVFVRSHGEAGRPLTVRTIPGGTEATIRGRVWVSGTADHLVFRDVKLDGANGLAVLQGGGDPELPGLASPTVDGDDVIFSSLDATNASAGCFLLGAARSRVQDNVIHDCAGVGARLGPRAQNADVWANLLEGNMRAVVFEGEEQEDGTYIRPRETRVTDNVIRNSRLEGGQWQVEGTYDADESWVDNLVDHNCLFQGNGMNIQDPRTAFEARDNAVVEACPGGYGPGPEAIYPPPPVEHTTVTLSPAARAVELKVPGSRAPGFLPLIAPADVRVGATVDVTSGRAKLTVSTGGAGTATLEIFGGSATVRQFGHRAIETELRLKGGYVGAAATSATRRKRRMWGRGKCRRCGIRGRYGKASHPRSTFLVEDRCKGTRVFVKEGSVRFKDFVTGRTRKIRTGESYTAKPRRRPC